MEKRLAGLLEKLVHLLLLWLLGWLTGRSKRA
jgi:hypothetical protein